MAPVGARWWGAAGRRSAKVALVAGAALGLCAWAAVSWWRSRNVSTVQRGWSVAQARGCFGGHGPGGVTGQPDMGVPAFSRDDLEAYV